MSDLSAAVEWLEKDYDETMRLELGQPWNGVRSIWAAGGPGGIPRPFFSIKGRRQRAPDDLLRVR